MSETEIDVARFVGDVFTRDGALCDVGAGGAVTALLPDALRAATHLTECVTLRVLGAPSEDEIALPLESSVMRWCLARALERGQAARATLDLARPRSAGSSEAVLAKAAALNGSLRASGTRNARLNVYVLEFGYEAIGEERADGNFFLAVEPNLLAVSEGLAATLLPRVAEARPAAGDVDVEVAGRAALAAEAWTRRVLTRRLEPLRLRLATRLERDARRVADYHDTLASEACRRRRSTDADDARDKKLAAIGRQREEKLGELVRRAAIKVRTRLASVLVLEYTAPVCDLVFLRRRREIPWAVAWDPFLREPLPRACAACGQPALALHGCEEAGHLTCASCAKPCATCRRVTCRACEPRACACASA